MRGKGGGPHGPDPQWLKVSRTHAKGITGRYRQSVVDYTGDGHKRINQWLRRGQVPVEPAVAAKVKDIDAVLARIHSHSQQSSLAPSTCKRRSKSPEAKTCPKSLALSEQNSDTCRPLGYPAADRRGNTRRQFG